MALVDKLERHRSASNAVLTFTSVVDGAVLAGVSQLASWASPLTAQVQSAAISAVIGALVSLALVAAVYLMREGMALADLRAESDAFGKPAKRDPNESPIRRKFVTNAALYVMVPAGVGAWGFAIALVASLSI